MSARVGLSLSFLDGTGVDTHLNCQDGPFEPRGRPIRLNVGDIRDGTPHAGSRQPLLEALAKDGTRFDIAAASTAYNATGSLRRGLSRMEALERAPPGSIASIEGLNEVDTWPVRVPGVTAASDLSLARPVRQQLHRDADGFDVPKDKAILTLRSAGPATNGPRSSAT